MGPSLVKVVTFLFKLVSLGGGAPGGRLLGVCGDDVQLYCLMNLRRSSQIFKFYLQLNPKKKETLTFAPNDNTPRIIQQHVSLGPTSSGRSEPSGSKLLFLDDSINFS